MPKIGMSELAPALAWPKYFYQGFNRQYFRKILAERPIAYWPLWEAAGSVAYDISGNGFHGAYVDITLGQDGIGDGRSCPLFDGAAGYVNIYSTGFRDAFDGDEGTIIVWAKVFDVGVWTDGDNARRMINLEANSNNFARVRKSANNQINYDKKAGSAIENTSKGSMTTVGWFHVAMSWTKTGDKVIYYYNGSQEGSVDTGLTAWDAVTLAVDKTLIGASWTSPSSLWHGYLSHAAAFDSAKSATVIANLAAV